MAIRKFTYGLVIIGILISTWTTNSLAGGHGSRLHVPMVDMITTWGLRTGDKLVKPLGSSELETVTIVAFLEDGAILVGSGFGKLKTIKPSQFSKWAIVKPSKNGIHIGELVCDAKMRAGYIAGFYIDGTILLVKETGYKCGKWWKANELLPFYQQPPENINIDNSDDIVLPENDFESYLGGSRSTHAQGSEPEESAKDAQSEGAGESCTICLKQRASMELNPCGHVTHCKDCMTKENKIN